MIHPRCIHPRSASRTAILVAAALTMLLALGSGCEERRRPTPPVPTESDTPGEPQESAQPSATLRSEAAQAMASAPSRTMRAIIAFVRFRDDDIVESGCMTRAKEAWRDPDVLPTVAHQLLRSEEH